MKTTTRLSFTRLNAANFFQAEMVGVILFGKQSGQFPHVSQLKLRAFARLGKSGNRFLGFPGIGQSSAAAVPGPQVIDSLFRPSRVRSLSLETRPTKLLLWFQICSRRMN